MARLESKKKMGYYPTPDDTLLFIKKWLNLEPQAAVLDPCCGEGWAVSSISPDAYGIELDPDRAEKAKESLFNVLTGSIYQAVVRPLQSFSLLYLNPPYDYEDGQRAEVRFLKHAHKWLIPEGVLVFLVPEFIFEDKRFRTWITKRYRDIRIMRFTRNDFPRFKQAVMLAVKKDEDVSETEFPEGPYPHIEDVSPVEYRVPPCVTPVVFEIEGVSEEDILENSKNTLETIKEVAGHLKNDKSAILSPIFPLRKGHLLALLSSGVLNGVLKKGNDEEIVFKSFCKRVEISRKEDGKQIQTDTYMSGIRVIEKGRWYDVR
jgi:SAM-dependent methyltransferase